MAASSRCNFAYSNAHAVSDFDFPDETGDTAP